jgi:hypothetical protein
MAATTLAIPRHLHNICQHIFGLENLKDGQFYFLNCHATCTQKVNIYLVGKILKTAAPAPSIVTPPAQQ